jgi:KipI family sensor histidine kinase inhibitor
MGSPRILSFGDQAILVEFGAEINPEINWLVRAFSQQATVSKVPGVGPLVPSYSSALIHFNPFLLSFAEITAWAKEILTQIPEGMESAGAIKEVPVTYGGLYGPDISYVAEHNGMDVQDVIHWHTIPTYLVYAIGGFPGLVAMGEVSSRIETPRLSNPRTKVAPGSVAIAGKQTGIYAIESPGGWQLIGRTPLRLFDPTRNPPVSFHPGDRVRFYQIREEEFRSSTF